MISEQQVVAAFCHHPIVDKMWIAKVGGCSVITGKFVNGGDYSLFELQEREGSIHGYLTMPQLLEKLNE